MSELSLMPTAGARSRVHLRSCAALALLLGLGFMPSHASAQDFDPRQRYGQRLRATPTPNIRSAPAVRVPQTSGTRMPAAQVQSPSRMPATQAQSPSRMRTEGPGRGSRYPGRGGGWGPAAVGLGAGIIGGLILDQARRQPVYEPDEPLPPPRRGRRPVYVDDYEIDEPVLERPRRREPVRAAAPSRPPPPAQTARSSPRQPGVIVPPATERRFVAEEILFELAPNAQADAVLRRHRATLIASRRFDLAGVTIIRARLNDGRSARTVLAQMAADRQVASAQPNYLYTLEQESTPAAEASNVEASAAELPATASPAAEAEPAKPPDVRAVALPEATTAASVPESAAVAPTILVPELPPVVPPVAVASLRQMQPQYIVEKLGLGDAHRLARGEKIKVAVIDSGADASHPELEGVLAGSFDALGGEALPHAHGTAMAAAILAQAQLQGVAPASRLLAARAFSGGASPASASGTTFHILTALDWGATEGARVFNLSFAGPQDRLLSRALAGARAKGIVSVAAAGNGGAKAAPLYPGADPNVIAVTATDADDKAFAGANRGSYIALAAPGVDVLAAEPQGRYAFTSGTSIAAAHVSGLVALILEKRPDLDLDGMRKLLMESAVDLGAKGRDPVFGAGRIDALAALARALPVSAARP